MAHVTIDETSVFIKVSRRSHSHADACCHAFFAQIDFSHEIVFCRWVLALEELEAYTRIVKLLRALVGDGEDRHGLVAFPFPLHDALRRQCGIFR